jgi:hypothetical protein
MSQTRADIDRKIALLEARARDLTPKRLSERYVPKYALDRAIGGLLTVIGLRMAWSLWRSHYSRRKRVRAALESYGA